MGQSNSIDSNNVNINCPTCMSKGKMPNIAGRFYLINTEECKCNGCGTVYKKEIIYKNYQDIENYNSKE